MVAGPILFVDDDPDTCASMFDVLTDRGYQVDTALGGTAALALTERVPYALTLVDYRMPGMNGLELFDRIRHLRPGAEGVLVTSFASNEVTEAAQSLGVRQVLQKPVDFMKLLPLIEDLAGKPLESSEPAGPDARAAGVWALKRSRDSQ